MDIYYGRCQIKKENIGKQLTSRQESLIGFKYLSYDINLLKIKSFNVKEIISLLNDLEINYIAIPHLDKDKGYFKSGKISDVELKLINSYIHQNIIYGFETKYQDEFFVKKIENINNAIKTLQNENASQEKILKLMEQISNLEKIKPLKSAFIYGSDYHGMKDSNYKDIEESLIYIKSECTFEGLRFALLDYESCIFSNGRKGKYDKSTNKVLEYIYYSINGKEDYLSKNKNDPLGPLNKLIDETKTKIEKLEVRIDNLYYDKENEVITLERYKRMSEMAEKEIN